MHAQSIIIRTAKVQSVDTDNRTVDIIWFGLGTGAHNVPIVNGPSDYSMPSEGDIGLVIGVENNSFYIGKVDYGYAARLADPKTLGLYKSLSEGDVYISNKKTTAGLALTSLGDFSLATGEDGFRHIASTRETSVEGQTTSVLGYAANFVVGMVRRLNQIVPLVPGGIVPAVEGLLEIALNGVRTARLHLGDVQNTVGVIEYSSYATATPLKAVLEVCNALGTPIAGIKIDTAGNIEITSKTGQVQVNGLPTNGIVLGELTAAQHAVLGEVLLDYIANHKHGTSVGPTSPPIVPPVAANLLSKRTVLD